MRELLAAVASAFLADAALPLLLWTALALLTDAALRLGRAHAALSLPVRSALLAALPAVLVAGPLVRWATPAAVVSEPLARVREAVLPEIVVGATAAVPAGPPDALVWIGAALVFAALLGTVALVRLVVAHVRLARLGWPTAPGAVQDAARAALDAAGVRRAVRVVSGGAVPFTFGALRPVVAVPPELSGEALRLALAHEAAHVCAGDYAWQVAAHVVAAVFAAHPLVHVLVRGLALDRERLADAAVLAARPNARRAYAELLVSLSDVPAPRLALGVARPPLLHRLTAMTTPASPSRVRAARISGRLVAALVLVGTALAAFTSARPDRAFRLLHPTITVDGTVVDRGESEFTAAPFRFFHVAVMEHGRFVVSDAPFEGAERAGTFEGPRLSVRVGDHTLGILAEADLFDGGAVFPAYARFDAYVGTSGSLEAPVVVVGVTKSLDDLEPVVSREEYARGMITAFRQRRVVVQESRVAGSSTRPADAFRLTAAGDTVFDFVGEMPELIGGVAALQAALVYPEEARRDSVEGRVILRFVVTAEGASDQIEVARSVDPRLDAAAVEALRAARFTPGRQDGRAVAVRMTLPVSFVSSASQSQRRSIYWDTDYSESLDSFVDMSASMRARARAESLAGGASGAAPSEGLTVGTAQARFRVGDQNRAVDIEVVSASSDAVGRLARFLALTTVFKDGAEGKTGTLTVTMSGPGGN